MPFRGLARAPLYTGQPGTAPAYLIRGNRVVAIARGMGQTSTDIQDQIITTANAYGLPS